jgi:hypothetical protein
MGEKSFITLLNCIVSSLNQTHTWVRCEALVQRLVYVAHVSSRRGSVLINVRKSSASLVVTDDQVVGWMECFRIDGDTGTLST